MNEQINNPNGKKKAFFSILIVGIAVIAIVGIIHFIRGFSRITTDDAYIEGRIHSVAAKVPGTVDKVFAEDNQPVKKGDPLAEIDPKDYAVKVKEAQAALEAEKARAIDAQAGINSAAANLQVQEAALHQASEDQKRAEALFKDNVLPKEKNEKAQTAYDIAVAQVKAAKEQVAKARSVKRLELSLITQRQAALEAAKLNWEYTKITAPSDGYVTKKSVEVGNQIQAGQPLMAVIALDDIWVTANYKETQLKDVRPGQKVEIKVDTYPALVFYGHVDSIMAGTGAVFSLFPTENALGNYVKVVQRVPVKIVLDKETDTRHSLRIGMSCIPTILLNE